MKLLDLKLRMMVLWIWISIAAIASFLFAICELGGLEEIISQMQKMGALIAIMGPIFWLGPPIMAFLSVTLKDKANRITNRVLSIIFTGLMLIEFYEIFPAPSVHQIIIKGSTIVAAAYIIFYSWKWPVKEA
jgi:hypothetical protein